jgi:hypothetical protein
MSYILSGVEGFVKNLNGQVICGANITTANGDTSVFSNTEGYYYFPHVAGTITMHCDSSGYKQWIKTGVKLAQGVTKLINIRMS